MSSTYHHLTRRPRRLAFGLAALASLALACAPRAPAAGSSVLQITGAGDGHGVGMSQEGALGFAQHGWSYRSILAHYYTGTSLGQQTPGTQVRVLLSAGRTRASFSGASLAAGHPLNQAAVYTVTLTGHGVTLRGPGVAISAPSLSVTGSGSLQLRATAENGVVNGSYRGALGFTRSGGGLDVINTLSLEDYVRGTIAAEMPASWPAAALDAQAVASRTYAITAQAGPRGLFDVYTDTRSQMYRGVAGETPATNSAAAATAGTVVTYKGRPAITFFFASSGGKTENVQDAFGGSAEPWLRGVSDPFDGGPQHHWSVSMSFASASARLAGLLRGSFRGIEVLRRGYSPRILSAYVLGSAGRTLTTGGELAARLGLYDSWAYFSVRTPHGLTPEPDLSSSAPTSPQTSPSPPAEPVGVAQGGTSAE
ncbi:MAG TPA: SpoIID/LytB domain-containing protein [Solirubrobacteraceae bacterium]